ncbi:radical SAM protein [Streptomyces sp. KLMMK]|uniref:radical SAM protein n=1 Tax=Streptomyces sp. KLMMK TaxID=3109353 RepID=UPI00300814C7
MLQHVSSCTPEYARRLPPKTRPVIRYRREDFGWLAAFPDGSVAMYDEGAEALLRAGEPPERCTAHLVERLSVETDFHFRAPAMVWLEITRSCNLRCPHCFVEGGRARSSELPTELIMRLLDEWAAMGVFSLIVTGGEPTMHPDFCEIVQRAYDLGFVIGIATNGTTLSERILSRIPQDDVIISMSIDGLHGQGKYRNEGEFAYVTRRLAELRDRGFNTSIMTTTTHENVDDLPVIIDWAKENDVSLRSVPFIPMGRGALHKDLASSMHDVERTARFWIDEEEWGREKDRTLGLCAGKVLDFLYTMVFATRRCMSARGVCYVNSAGDVFPCSTCAGNKVLCGGNVQLTPFAGIWESEDWLIRKITWDNYRDTCEGCPINDDKYFCTGRCPSQSSILNGTFDGCGTSDFQLQSILRREELFRARIMAEPRVELRRGERAGPGARDAVPAPAPGTVPARSTLPGERS